MPGHTQHRKISSQGWSWIKSAVADNLEDITTKISYDVPYMLQIVQAVAKYNKQVKHTFCCEFLNCTEVGVDVSSCVLRWNHFLHLRLHVSSQSENTRNGKYTIGTSARKFWRPMFSNKTYRPFFFGEETVTRTVGFSSLKKWMYCLSFKKTSQKILSFSDMWHCPTTAMQ